MATSRAPRQRRHSATQGRTEQNVPLPVDILLGIFSILSIRDVLNIRQTCRHFYEITQLRSLWHLLLRHLVLQKNLPIPGLGNRQIETLSSRDLEHCTRRALRLRRNWVSKSPSVARSFIQPLSEGQQTRNIALQFLPGPDQRRLLSITAVTNRQGNWFAVQCWNVDVGQPVCVARLRVTELASFAVNTDYNSRAVLALLVPQSVYSIESNGNDKLIRFCSVEIYTINFSANSPESAFVCMASIRRQRLRELHAFSGSSILCQAWSGYLTYWNLNTPDVEAELADTTPQLENCRAAILHGDFAMVIRPSQFQLYFLGSYRTATNSGIQNFVIQPVAQHGWWWQAHSACMSLMAPPYATTSSSSARVGFPIVRALIRFTSTAWPDNYLHHYVLQPNAAFTRARVINAPNVPYLPPSSVQSLASPVVLGATTHAALSPHGTALWIDNHIEDPEMMSGQRLAGELLRSVNDDNDDDDNNNGTTRTRGGRGRSEPSWASSQMTARATFAMQQPLTWLHVALDETGSRIAVGGNDGKIEIFTIA